MQIVWAGCIIISMKDRRSVFIICLALLLCIGPVWSDSAEESEKAEAVRTGSLITGAALGLGTVTIYSIGPYTGMDFKGHPVASTSIIAASSLTAVGSSVLFSRLFAEEILESEAGPVESGLEGVLAGALAGGMTNGLAFATMFGIGVPSGVIEMNEPFDEHLDTWYKSASLGFMGGFMYGIFFGALAGAIGGPAISFSMGF